MGSEMSKAARLRDHVQQCPRAEHRVHARLAHLPQHGDALSSVLCDDDGNLRLSDVVAFPQAVCHQSLSVRSSETRQLNVPKKNEDTFSAIADANRLGK